MASLNGLFVPIGVIVYGEFTSLLIDRTVMTGTSTETLTISLFGGGRVLTNANAEENKKALIEDSQAFGIGCATAAFIQFLIGAVSVDLINYSALNDVEKLREGIGEKVAMLVYLVMSFVCAVVISFVYGWELTLIVLACTPLKAYSIAGVIAEEVLASIRTVVAFGGEDKEIK
ncbi:ATP-binding cassette sub-family B member 2, partial [Operophtera brumata]